MDSILWTWAIFGIAMVVIIARLIPGKVNELFFFSAIFGIAEAYIFWAVEFLNAPPLPLPLAVFLGAGLIFWLVMRGLYVAGLFIYPPLAIVPIIFLGK